MDKILAYREDYPQAWSQAIPRPCGISRGVEEPLDDHGGHRDDDRPHDRLTLVQADLPGDPNRLRTRKGRRNEDG